MSLNVARTRGPGIIPPANLQVTSWIISSAFNTMVRNITRLRLIAQGKRIAAANPIRGNTDQELVVNYSHDSLLNIVNKVFEQTMYTCLY